MANEMISEMILEDEIADIWPEYPCLYDVRIPEFKNRDLRDRAFRDMAEKLQKSGRQHTDIKLCFFTF